MKKWTTFYGKTINFTELSHQHLSNILWMHQLFIGSTDGLNHIQEQIDLRFGGIRLPYSPMISFTQEINLLKRKGYITDELESNIIVDGKWIGEVKYS